MSDEPRLLHERSEYGYTSQPIEAMGDEPEAVPADYQQRLSRDAKTSDRERQLEALRAAIDEIEPALDAVARLKLDRDLRSTTRAMERQLRQLKQLVGRR